MKFFDLLFWRIKRRIRNFLYPPYDCEDCIGMIQHGCQCEYYEAWAPGIGPPPIIKRLRTFAKSLGIK